MAITPIDLTSIVASWTLVILIISLVIKVVQFVQTLGGGNDENDHKVDIESPNFGKKKKNIKRPVEEANVSATPSVNANASAISQYLESLDIEEANETDSFSYQYEDVNRKLSAIIATLENIKKGNYGNIIQNPEIRTQVESLSNDVQEIATKYNEKTPEVIDISHARLNRDVQKLKEAILRSQTREVA